MLIIIFVFILSTLYPASFAQSDPLEVQKAISPNNCYAKQERFIRIIIKPKCQSCIFCQYGGALSKYVSGNSFTFSIQDVPKRCDVISYGATYINSQPAEEDASAIAELKSAGKTVYMLYTIAPEDDWIGIISSTNPIVLDNYIAPMLTYVNENKVDGVVLDLMDFFAEDTPNYSAKIAGMLCRIKECAPNLKISTRLLTRDPSNYGNTELFDFADINNLIEFYFVDVSMINSCGKSTTATNGGRIPISSTGPNDTRLTLEQVYTIMQSSGIDTSKLYVTLNDMVSKFTGGFENDYLPYSEYCATSVSETDIYCVDTMQQFYDAAVYAKSHFKGIIIMNIDYDDFDNSCSCEKFPVANAYIDAWTGQPLKCCDKIG